LALAVLGGLVGVDGVSCLQSMVARPIVAGPVAGALAGDPIAGMWAGVFLELISLKELPIGANRHWDTGPAAVVATVAAVTISPASLALLIGVGSGVFVGWVGGWSIHSLRRVNASVVASAVGQPQAPAALERRHFAALGLDFARALVLTLAGTIGVLLVAPRLGDAPQGGVTASAVVLFVAASAALGVVVGTMVRGRRIIGAFAAAILVSTVMTLWLR
jgi:mannose/fructose/N-acetylgalactosamine-specific phosphotransferase system component IIC